MLWYDVFYNFQMIAVNKKKIKKIILYNYREILNDILDDVYSFIKSSIIR